MPGKVVFELDRQMCPEEGPAGVEAVARRGSNEAAATRAGITVEIERLLLAQAMQPLPYGAGPRRGL